MKYSRKDILRKGKKFKLVIWFFLSIVMVYPLQMAHASDYNKYIVNFINGNPQEKKEIQNKFFRELEKEYNPEDYEWVHRGQLIFADIDGNGEKECIAAVGDYPIRATVFVFKKNDKSQYDLVDHFTTGILEKIQTVSLIKPGVSEIVIDCVAQGTWRYLYRKIYKWDGMGTRCIWEGVVEDIFYGELSPDDTNYDVQANIRYVDLDGDGIKEIIREGTLKRCRQNKETREWDIVVSENKFYREYKWDPKAFKYQLKVSQGIDRYQSGEK